MTGQYRKKLEGRESPRFFSPPLHLPVDGSLGLGAGGDGDQTIPSLGGSRSHIGAMTHMRSTDLPAATRRRVTTEIAMCLSVARVTADRKSAIAKGCTRPRTGWPTSDGPRPPSR